MKKVLIALLGFHLFLIEIVAGLYVLSETYPLRPGMAFYRVQSTAEQWRLKLAASNEHRAEFALDLAERRLADLAAANSSKRVRMAAIALDRATDEAVRRLEPLSAGDQTALFERLSGFLGRAEVVVAAIEPDDRLVALVAKLAALREAGSIDRAVALVPPAPRTLAEALPIPFLSSEVDHDTYPLEGGHVDVECEACHPGGLYAGTPPECDGCHPAPAGDLYVTHFAGACDECHTVANWEVSEFDHAGIVECASCHDDDNPQDHYTFAALAAGHRYFTGAVAATSRQPALGSLGTLLAGWQSAIVGASDPCAPCHVSTDDWQITTFDHARFSDCVSCHPPQRGIDHPYDNECAACHGTVDWQTVAYDHDGVAECLPCHAADSPGAHYLQPADIWLVAWIPQRLFLSDPAAGTLFNIPETCANCHANTDEWHDVSFDHTHFADCTSCHIPDTPVDHYVGRCEQCHVTESSSNRLRTSALDEPVVAASPAPPHPCPARQAPPPTLPRLSLRGMRPVPGAGCLAFSPARLPGAALAWDRNLSTGPKYTPRAWRLQGI